MVSLPVPLGCLQPNLLGDHPTQVQPVAWWPESVSGKKGVVRRQLMFVVSEGLLPEEFSVTEGEPVGKDFKGPEASVRIVSKKNTGILLSEVNEVAFTFGEKNLGLRLGLQHGGEYHWWEWVRVEELWAGPVCKAVRIGGFIEVEHFGDESLTEGASFLQHKALHWHNWLFGEVYALLFSNGVVHLTCRHINNHLFDQGRDLEDVVPVIAFNRPGASDVEQSLDGTQTQFDLGGIALNLDEAAALFGPEHPGKLCREQDLVIYHPYSGVEIHGDAFHREREDGYIVKTEEKRFPKGVARTVRFAAGLGESAPVLSRLVVPDWWYALARELWGDEALPVHDRCDRVIESCESYVAEATRERPRCFDNSALNRSIWEGEIPFSQMLYFYLSGNLDYFGIALDESYYMADLGFDHATETIRMQNYPFGAVAPPLYRTASMTFAYLETGDPYLLECSESAATRFYWIDRHNWPRRTYGRDAASLRSLVFLWDYTGKEDYLSMVREALGRSLQCQRPDGSVGDQGGAVGVQGGCANEITKNWMTLLANEPVVDYLLRRPGDQELLESLMKAGAFVLNSQLEENGVYSWAYQYGYGDNPGDPWDMKANPETFTPFPAGRLVSGYKARFLTFLTELTRDPCYLEAWQKFYDTNWGIAGQEPRQIGYCTNKIIEYLPYLQAHTWSARWEEGRVRVRPLITQWARRAEGEISTPRGPLAISCVVESNRVTVETRGQESLEVLVELPGYDEPASLSGTDRRTLEWKGIPLEERQR